jgi:hypothetical protein
MPNTLHDIDPKQKALSILFDMLSDENISLDKNTLINTLRKNQLTPDDIKGQHALHKAVQNTIAKN